MAFDIFSEKRNFEPSFIQKVGLKNFFSIKMRDLANSFNGFFNKSIQMTTDFKFK